MNMLLQRRVLAVLVPMVMAELAGMHMAMAQSASQTTTQAAAAAPAAASGTAAAEADAAQASAPQAKAKATPSRADVQLGEVSVTANRLGATDVTKSAATVSVITSDDLEENNAKDIKDALQYEPGVTVRRQGYRPTGISNTGRGGNEGINIRGLEGNQVLMLEDGIPLPQSFSYGSGSAGRGDYLNTDFYERIEVLRGPASVLYGSDGLTGAVNFVTKDPSDLLAKFGKNTYFSLRGSYDSADRSVGGTAAAAFRNENDSVEAMVMLSGRHGHETSNYGDVGGTGASRTKADPLTYNNRSALGKVVFKLSPRDTLKFTAATLSNANSSDGLSQVGNYTWSGYTATSYLTNNYVNSNRVKLEWDHADENGRYLQHLKASLFYRNASTDQTLYIGGSNTAGTTSSRIRDNHYGDNIFGGSLVAESAFATGPVAHRMTYGVDASLSHYSTSSSAGSEWTSATSGYPEVFPKTSQVNLGVYAQDELRWNRFSLVPGVRFDYFNMSPQADATYSAASAASTQATASSNGSAVSPRLALMYEISPALIPYVQYARGFRAPSAYQINSYYGSSAGYYYQQVGNPNLKPETSNTYELGMRGKFAIGSSRVRYSTSAFYGRYNNFIDMVTIGGSMTSATNPLTYQYINYSHATIKGVEAKGQWFYGDSWEVKGGMAYIKGTAENGGKSTGLDTVPPFAAVLGVKYRFADQWFVGADLTYNSRKDKADMSSSSYYSTPSFTILDLHAGYQISKHVSVNAGIGNVFDRKYWRWNDVRGLADSDGYAKITATTAPGRTFNVGMKIDF